MAENFAIFDFDLTPEDLQAIAGLDTGKSAFFDHRDPEVVKRLAGARRRT
jgi:2,5-diketo-D-gluconate reductase A